MLFLLVVTLVVTCPSVCLSLREESVCHLSVRFSIFSSSLLLLHFRRNSVSWVLKCPHCCCCCCFISTYHFYFSLNCCCQLSSFDVAVVFRCCCCCWIFWCLKTTYDQFVLTTSLLLMEDFRTYKIKKYTKIMIRVARCKEFKIPDVLFV